LNTLEKVLHNGLLCLLLYSPELFHGLWNFHQHPVHPVGHDSFVRTVAHGYAAAVTAVAGVEAEEGEEKKSPGSS